MQRDLADHPFLAAAVRRSPTTRPRRIRQALAASCLALLTLTGLDAEAQVASAAVTVESITGPNVLIFDPSMPTAQIQASVDAIATQQISNQFGTQRYALLFKPGTYGSPASPLNFKVGYYTSVAGLGKSPNDVVINGSVNAYNQCDSNNSCTALNNFWRSISNLTINVNNGSFGCYSGEFWAVSQAAPMRRVHVNGNTTLMDYCTGPSYASGGFIADSQFDGGTVISGSQQQWVVRNSQLDGWTNGVWNQVFSGVVNAPANCFPAQASCGGPYTTLAASPVTREAPYLYIDANGHYNVFVPAARSNSVGSAWGNANDPGTSLPIWRFFIVKPSYPTFVVNTALALGFNLIFTPGVYHLDRPLVISRPDTVVLGLGYPTLVPMHGSAAMSVGDVPGVKLAGLMFDAGPLNSPVLLQVGKLNGRKSQPANPTTLSDVFFRIGGATAGKATVSLQVNSDNVLLDNIWAWRADHGNGVGWTANTADTGLIVNGKSVTAYGLFVEHYQKHEVLWNADGGQVIFFQNEMPYDPPSQTAWMQSPGVYGWSAFKIANSVRTFNGYGMGSYSFFNQGLDIYAANAFEVPATLAPGSLHDLLTVFLDPVNGRGGILNVVNGIGGSSTVANPGTPVTVVSYP